MAEPKSLRNRLPPVAQDMGPDITRTVADQFAPPAFAPTSPAYVPPAIPFPNSPELTNTPPPPKPATWHDMVDDPAYKVASLLPGPNIPMSALAYTSHMMRDQPLNAVGDAVGIIPGLGWAGAKVAHKALKASPVKIGYPGSLMGKLTGVKP